MDKYPALQEAMTHIPPQGVMISMEGIGLILGVDRLLDMCRTVVNVTGDAMVSTVIAKQVGQLKTE
jgi:Na+/H+-dicarboxylate symporter